MKLEEAYVFSNGYYFEVFVNEDCLYKVRVTEHDPDNCYTMKCKDRAESLRYIIQCLQKCY